MKNSDEEIIDPWDEEDSTDESEPYIEEEE